MQCAGGIFDFFPLASAVKQLPGFILESMFFNVCTRGNEKQAKGGILLNGVAPIEL